VLCALLGIISRDQCAVVVVSDVFIAAYDVAVIGDGGADVIAAAVVVVVVGANPTHTPPSEYVTLSALGILRYYQS
jgi:hypothetical protein